MDFERVEARIFTYVSSKRRSLEGCNFFQRNLSTLSMENVSLRLLFDYIYFASGRESKKY